MTIERPMFPPRAAATKEGASSNAAVRRRIALIAAERKLDPSETAALMKGRWLTLRNLSKFAEKHNLRIDWLITGDLRWHPRRGSSPCHAVARPRAMTDQEFAEALAVIDENSRQFLVSYMMQLLADGGGAA